MKAIPMNLTIDRHITNGSAAIRGSVNGQKVNVLVERGVDDGSAYVNGQVGEDRVRVTIPLEAHNGYSGVKGVYGKTRLNAELLRHQPDGDTTISGNGQQLFVDRQDRGRSVILRSDVVGGSFARQQRDGDESGSMRVGRQGFDYALDRDTHDGGFILTGRTDEGSFRLDAQRNRSDGDLTLRGTVPDGLQLFPLLWEVLGDDKNIIDRNPEYPGSIMAMSLFLQNQG